MLQKVQTIFCGREDRTGRLPSFAPPLYSLREFLEHYDKCENCREEVEIQYLVSRAFDHRKEKEVINLSRDLPALVEKERSSMVFRSRLGYTAYTLEILTILLVLMTVFIFLR